jgi:hypothetical protein
MRGFADAGLTIFSATQSFKAILGTAGRGGVRRGRRSRVDEERVCFARRVALQTNG